MIILKAPVYSLKLLFSARDIALLTCFSILFLNAFAAHGTMFQIKKTNKNPLATQLSIKGRPAVFGITPSTMHRGTKKTATIKGRSLHHNMQLKLGKGVKTSNLTIINEAGTMAVVLVTVLPDADLGSRTVKVLYNDRITNTSARFTITNPVIPKPKSKLTHKPKPVKKIKLNLPKPGKKNPNKPIISFFDYIDPIRWYTGMSYEVNLYGSHLSKDMRFSFGKGIKIKNQSFKKESLIKFTIFIEKKAKAGSRVLTYKTSQFGSWFQTKVKGLVIQGVHRSKQPIPGIKFPSLTDIEFTKGKIDLKTPEFGNYWMMENWEADHGIPTSNDAIVFTWQEAQPGTSQWFELQILDRKNNIIVKRKVKENFYAPDVDFIMEIFKKFRPKNSSPAPGQILQISGKAFKSKVLKKPGFKKFSAKKNKKSLTRDEQYIVDNLNDIDCFWKVVGYKTHTTYNITTNQVIKKNDVEVAISERWPLQLPEYSPTGLICSKANTELTYGKYYEEEGKTITDTNIFVGDIVMLSGKFTLDGCPWAIGYESNWHGTSPGPVSDSYELWGWRFENVFVDWGDGEYQRVSAEPDYKMTAFEAADGSGLPPNSSGKPMGTLKIALKHVYKYSQKFPIRFFVLPEEDVGSIDSIVKANKAAKGQTVPQNSAQNNHSFKKSSRVLVADSNMIATDAPTPIMPEVSASKPKLQLSKKQRKLLKQKRSFSRTSALAGLEAPGSQAFLLYCQPKVIDIKPDPASTGDLHLINMEFTGFSGQDSAQIISLNHAVATRIPSYSVRNQTSLPKGMGKAKKKKFKKISKKPLPKIKKKSDLISQLKWGNKNYNADAIASTCDEAFYAKASLEYFGLGKIVLTWKIDGFIIAREEKDIGPSPIRTELDDNYEYTESIKHGVAYFRSPELPLELINNAPRKYAVTVEASVKGYESSQAPPPGFDPLSGEENYSTPPHNEYLKYTRREAPLKTYLVTPPNPGQPCRFKFPVAGNRSFIISNLQNRIIKKNGKYHGMGTIYFDMPDSSGGMTKHFVDISFKNWEVPDNETVKKGSINAANLGITIDNLQGMTAVLRSLKGNAGDKIEATMDVFVKDPGIHMTGTGTPPGWSNVKATLIPEDGWYAEGKTMPLTEIYWSDFQIESNDVRLDLSLKLNGKIKSKGSSSAQPANLKINKQPALQKTEPSAIRLKPGRPSSLKLAKSPALKLAKPSAMNFSVKDWTGISLGSAKIYPYLFDLVDTNVPAPGWSITNNGLSGRALFNDFSYVLGDGSIAFDSIDITAKNHGLTALYKNVRVNIPWPEITIKGGNGVLSYKQGQDTNQLGFKFNVDNLNAKEEYGNIVMTSKIKSFDRLGSGWGITTDTIFDFSDGRNPFASVEIKDLFFNVFGVAHFKGSGEDVHDKSIPISESSLFGDAPFTINGLNVHASTDWNNSDRIAFTFTGEIDFPELNVDDVNVYYAIKKSPGAPVNGIGPGHSDIKVSMTYPSDVDAVTHIDVYPEINLPNGNTGVVNNSHTEDSSLLGSLFVSSAWAATGVKDSFRGKVDSKMFGDTPLPIQAEFRYGVYNNKAYWLTHVKGTNINVPLFSGVNLKGVNGGLAHGFDESVFANNPMEAIPNSPDKTVYSAGITIGSPDPGIYRLTGQLTVNPEDGVYRMDFFKVSLFGIGLGGGYFEYDNNVFEGNVWGGFSLYNGIISCEIPKNSERVGLHFGSDYWEIWAGKKENPVEMSLFHMASTYGYYQFGSEVGYRLGAGYSFNTGKLCLGIAAGRLYANSDMSMAITPKKLNGHFDMGAGLEAWVPCSGKLWNDSFGKSVQVNVSVPPLKMSVETSIDVPDWLPGVPDDITLRFGI